MSMNFESSVYVNSELSRQLLNTAQDLAQRSVKACAEYYNFDSDEAIRLLGLTTVKQSRNRVGGSGSVKSKKEKVVVEKPSFPLPYNGELNEMCCNALRQNNGLYTQCQSIRKGDSVNFCKQCQVLSEKGVDGVPEYGTIQMRQEVGIFEYIDPLGRKPVSYTKVMKKYKITQEQAIEEATKFNVVINEQHFVVPESESKRGRPSSLKDKAPKEPKGTKGRPKKTKKVLQVDGEVDDLFATLVADANSNSAEEVVVPTLDAKPPAKKKVKSEEEREAERIAKEAEKAEKEAKRLAEKAEKEAKIAAEKAEKEAKIATEKAEKEAKIATEKAEKEAKIATEKAEKEAKRLAEKAEKEAKLAEKEAAKANKKKKEAPVVAAAAPIVEDDEEQDVVKKIEIEGKKYLKSKKTGIIYDYQEYVKNGEQVVVGKWNDSTNKIDFTSSEEEEEEEYEM